MKERRNHTAGVLVDCPQDIPIPLALDSTTRSRRRTGATPPVSNGLARSLLPRNEPSKVRALAVLLLIGHSCVPRIQSPSVVTSFQLVPSSYGGYCYLYNQRSLTTKLVPAEVNDDSRGPAPRPLPPRVATFLAAESGSAANREPVRRSSTTTSKRNDVGSTSSTRGPKRKRSDHSPNAGETHQPRHIRNSARKSPTRRTMTLDTNVSSYSIFNQVPRRTHTTQNLRTEVDFPMRQSNLNSTISYPAAMATTTKSDPPPETPSVPLYAPLPTPSLKVQLGLARDGHAVLRQWLSPYQNNLWQLRNLLQNHCQRHELQAWRQKVEVAADNDRNDSTGSSSTTRLLVSPSLERAQQLAASCRSVVECQTELRRLLGNDTAVSLPFLQFFNTWRHHPPVLALAQALAEPAAVLLNVPSVRLYQDAVFWKRRGKNQADGPTPWHADARLAPFDTSRMLTFWIPLQQTVTSSGLVFCSQSHSDFALPFWHDSLNNDDPDSPWWHLEERYGGGAALVDYMPLQLGDVTVHAGWTLHCADPVDADDNDDRWALAVTFVDARALVRPDALSSSRGDREDAWSYRDWFHDVPITMDGGRVLWDHPLVPILWPQAMVAPVTTTG